MCLVIDACVIPKVFGEDPDFRPVYIWVVEGDGKLIAGGTKYAKEVAKLKRYTSLLAELSRQGKVVTLNKTEVDAAEKKIRAIEPKKDFDDPHLIALVDESGCRVICSDDRRADKYLRDAKFYRKAKKPAIYRYAKRHTHLLSEKNIVGKCC